MLARGDLQHRNDPAVHDLRHREQVTAVRLQRRLDRIPCQLYPPLSIRIDQRLHLLRRQLGHFGIVSVIFNIFDHAAGVPAFSAVTMVLIAAAAVWNSVAVM